MTKRNVWTRAVNKKRKVSQSVSSCSPAELNPTSWRSVFCVKRKRRWPLSHLDSVCALWRNINRLKSSYPITNIEVLPLSIAGEDWSLYEGCVSWGGSLHSRSYSGRFVLVAFTVLQNTQISVSSWHLKNPNKSDQIFCSRNWSI